MADEERDAIVQAMLDQQGWGNVPSSENIQNEYWRDIPQGWSVTPPAQTPPDWNDSGNLTGLGGELGNQDIYNQNLKNMFNYTQSSNMIAGDQPPIFDPKLNAGTMGYDPYANPNLDPQPPEGWFPDRSNPFNYTPDPIYPGGVPGGDTPLTVPDVPMQAPDVPEWRGPILPIDPTVPQQGFFEGVNPYDNAGASGIPGSYGAPGMYGHRRDNL